MVRSLPLLHEPDDVDRLRRAGRAARRVLDRVTTEVGPGVSTDELDAVAHDAYIAEGGYPSTLGYRGFPKSICTSVNEVAAHGIPDDRPLHEGDIVNCDVTIFLDGMHGDCSATVAVGEVSDGTRDLMDATETAMWAGIEAVRPGARLYGVGRAIEAAAAARGYEVVRALAGHGIGEQFHAMPVVRHYADPRDRQPLEPGMAFTIEPALTMGEPELVMWDDGWTIVTFDGQPSPQWEHTVLVVPDGVEVVTAGPADGRRGGAGA